MESQAIDQRLAVAALALLAVVVYTGWGLREQRFIVAPLALVIGALVFFGIVPAVIGYGVLCLAMASVYMIREERARRRRIASLAPRPAVDVIPAIWIATAAASALMLIPYVVFAQERAAALMIGFCALLMAAIARQIVSAPLQLTGVDAQSERIRDRAMRLRRAGITAVLAVGIVFVFISFVNGGLPIVMPVQRTLNFASFALWAALWAWVTLYVRQIDRASSVCS